MKNSYDSKQLRTIYDSKVLELRDEELQSFARTEQVSDSIHISQLSNHFTEECREQTVGPATFCIAVFFKANGRMAIDKGAPLVLRDDTTIVFHTPRETSGWHHIKADSEILCLDLRFSPDLLKEYEINSLNILSPMFQNNCSVQDCIMLSRPTTVELKQIGKDIMQCELQGIARRLFLQAKALEALAYIVGACEVSQEQQVNSRDQRRIMQAIELLNQEYSRSWTISQLSQEVGLNEKKLKYGFRQQVQTTIQAYLEQVRLNSACEQLREGGNITDVALQVGFSNPSYFTKRFKLKFSMTPKEWITKHCN